MPVIRFERQGPIAVVTLQGDNDLNLGVVHEELWQHLVSVRDDGELRCGVITGHGTRAFSAGADLRLLAAAEAPRRNPWTVRILDLLNSPDFGKPIIAAVNGHAIGQGLMLALACDIRVASKQATFGLAEVRHGMFPSSAAIQQLVRVMPLGPALELLLTGDRISAEQALQ